MEENSFTDGRYLDELKSLLAAFKGSEFETGIHGWMVECFSFHKGEVTPVSFVDAPGVHELF